MFQRSGALSGRRRELFCCLLADGSVRSSTALPPAQPQKLGTSYNKATQTTYKSRYSYQVRYMRRVCS